MPGQMILGPVCVDDVSRTCCHLKTSDQATACTSGLPYPWIVCLWFQLSTVWGPLTFLYTSFGSLKTLPAQKGCVVGKNLNKSSLLSMVSAFHGGWGEKPHSPLDTWMCQAIPATLVHSQNCLMQTVCATAFEVVLNAATASDIQNYSSVDPCSEQAL